MGSVGPCLRSTPVPYKVRRDEASGTTAHSQPFLQVVHRCWELCWVSMEEGNKPVQQRVGLMLLPCVCSQTLDWTKTKRAERGRPSEEPCNGHSFWSLRWNVCGFQRQLYAKDPELILHFWSQLGMGQPESHRRVLINCLKENCLFSFTFNNMLEHFI